MLWLALRSKFFLFNAGLVLTPGPKPPEGNKHPCGYSRQYGNLDWKNWTSVYVCTQVTTLASVNSGDITYVVKAGQI